MIALSMPQRNDFIRPALEALAIKGDPMAQLVFRCPYTNKPIASGMDIHVPSFRELSDYPIGVECPHCRIRHHGTIADGCLADENPSPLIARPRDVAARMKKR